ncbi:MAG TPA: adenylate/guanylate cyclase domain-containing protein [Gaiellaceae bacterium]|nr:adenylate/guanylate cyclase domain-containing protein [Gaiellaceae bacterium]
MTRAARAGNSLLLAAAGLVLPLVGLVILLAAPELDVRWEHHPAHFWLVLAAAITNVVLAVVTGDAARRRSDARLFLVSLAFLAGAGFLALHALATPGVLLDAPNTGFVVATPIGLLVAGALAAASSLELAPEASTRLIRRSHFLRAALLGAMGAWALVSLAGWAPLEEPLPEEEADGWLLGFAVAGIALYALAAGRYLREYRRRRAPLLLAVVAAFALLAEAMVAIALARNWHASWWEWHLLMLAAFGVVAWSARREWHEERFAGLYLPETAGATRDGSFLFADLQGFTRFAERVGPDASADVTHTYFERLVPLVARRYEGEVGKLIGDAIMVTFNARGDQPDHALRAVQAALALRREAGDVADDHPDWPRFRIAVNSGEARFGVTGAWGKREYTAVGDAVNLAARLEGEAEPGQVVIGAETYRRLPDGTQVEPLGRVRVRGKEAPVDAYVVLGLPAGGHGRGERLEHENGEPEHDGGRR